jgi:hypothetical protein
LVLAHRQIDGDVRIAFDKAHDLTGQFVAALREARFLVDAAQHPLEPPDRLFPQVEHREPLGLHLVAGAALGGLDLDRVGIDAARQQRLELGFGRDQAAASQQQLAMLVAHVEGQRHAEHDLTGNEFEHLHQ